MLHAIPPTVPAIIAPATVALGDRDSFPKCRAAGGGGPVVYTCPKAQTRLYWVDLARTVTDPEHGPMVEEFTVDAEVTMGYLPEQGGGEVTRLKALIAADMPGWEIIGLQLADAPEVEF